MDINGDVEEFSRRIQVRFVTKLQAPFKVPSTSIAIPSNLTRMGLSAILNNLLQAGNADWKTEPFDFLINGELVRMSLEEFLLAQGISAEKILEIEYIKAVAPRKEEEPSLHDDWVNAVDGSNPGFASVSEDNLNLMPREQQVVDSLSSHPTVRPMSHQQQSHAFSSQEVHLSKKEKKNKKKKKN